MITSSAAEKIYQFNKIGLHYNLVADAVYNFRNFVSDPFDSDYMPYIIAALVSFDMRRMMGPDANRMCDRKAGGFATFLEKKVNAIKPYISHLANLRLDDISPRSEEDNIMQAYAILCSAGEDGLNRRGGAFHVGATKILHFINPEAFIIVDSNAARAFKLSHHVRFRNTTQPGYSSDKYIDCMEHAKRDILNFGVTEFCSLDKGVPMARIYDKLTFMTGSKKP
jgi:hypothetical protein